MHLTNLVSAVAGYRNWKVIHHTDQIFWMKYPLKNNLGHIL